MSSPPTLLEVFNRYRERGGEEKAAELIHESAQDLCRIERLWFDSRDWDGPDGPGLAGQVCRCIFNPDSARELKRRVAELSPSGILCHNLFPVASPSIYKAALDLQTPVLQYVHNFRPFSVGATLWTGRRIAAESLRGNFAAEILSGAWQGSVVKSAIMALALKQLHWRGWLDAVHGWIAVSEFMREKFLAAGIAAEKVVALRHPWKIRTGDGTGAEKAAATEGDYYLFLSRLVPEKGVGCLLQAWQNLAKERGSSCPRLLVGGTGPEEDSVRRVAEKSDRIDYLGFVEGRRKQQLISRCRAMLAPSLWWEPLGLVTYEAYEHRRPMIAAASGGLTETVCPDRTGWLHAPGDADALAASVASCEAAGAEGRRDRGRAGRQWLEENASPDRWRDEFQSVLTRFL